MKFSIALITTPKRIRFFDYCVKILLKQSVLPDEVIIIINGLNNKLTLNYCKEFLKNNLEKISKLRVITVAPSTTVGFCRNLAVKISSGDYIIFIDDDVVLDEKWLENIQKCLIYNPDIISGRVEPLCDFETLTLLNKHPYFGEFISVKNYLFMKFRKRLGSSLYVVKGIRGLWTNNLVIKKEFINKIGNFKKILGYLEYDDIGGEDTELKHRAEKYNPLIIYNHSAIVYHRVSKKRLSINYCFKRAWKHGMLYSIILPLNSVIKGFVYNLISIPWYIITNRMESFLALTRALTLFSSIINFNKRINFLNRRLQSIKNVRTRIVEI